MSSLFIYGDLSSILLYIRLTTAHMHNGSPRENGSIIVTLFILNPVQGGISINGSIAANNPENPMQEKTVADLVGTIKNNTAYINVHTE